ncbi:hypothetical protein [Tissierella praeacuta]|nr:hypothetical protein [Tissierella praeacuta]
MAKNMERSFNCIFNNIKKYIVIAILAIITIVWIYKYNYKYHINYTYDAIKYQSNNINSEIPIKIVVKGVYRKEHGSKDYIFKGDIIVDGELCYGSGRERNEYAFNKYNMSSIEINGLTGNLFISDMMEEMSITIFESKQDGGKHFSYNDGWLISAPCNTRCGAVTISNKLIQKLHKGIVIE